MNIESQIYTVINELLALKICNTLDIKSLFIFKSQLIREFNDELSKRLITHVIYSCLIVNDYMKQICSILLIRLNTHKIILNKL